MAKYVILNDGETYAPLDECIVFDDVIEKAYTVKIDKRRPLKDTTYWEKGICDILEVFPPNNGMIDE